MEQLTLDSLGGAGILLESDLPELAAGVRKAFELLRDGRWHSRIEIEAHLGQSEAMRRVRQLRNYFEIEKRRVDNRVFEYRLKHD